MSTLKLKKPAVPAAPGRAPVRSGGGARPRPTLAEAQAQRAQRARFERNAPAPTRKVKPGSEPAAPAARTERSRSARATPVAPGGAAAREGERLSKRMTALGLASRREADEWIEAGWVRADGRVAVLGQRVAPDVRIEIDAAAGRQQLQRVTILFNKPLGIVSGQAEDGHTPAISLIGEASRWSGDTSGRRFSTAHLRQLAPAGRLDIDSVGLLVLTQDGRIAKQLVGEQSNIEKEYLVRVRCIDPQLDANGPPSHCLPIERLERLRHGLVLDDVALKPAKVSWQNEVQMRFALREGRKRQIRRVCELVGLQVLALKRVRIGRISLGALPPGQWRYLAPFERF